MTDLEVVEICVKLSSTFWNQPPKVKVFVDDLMIFNADVNSPESIFWSGPLEDGEHTLTIELYDKEIYQTVVENGNIIKDQILNVDALLFDDIEVGYLRQALSKYYPNKAIYKDAPDILEQCVNLGYNGKWEFKFSCPTYLWLLENV